MQKFDLHMHTTYCDGKDSAEAMVVSAIENGLSTVGISGHSFTPHDTSYCMTREGTQKYIEEIRALKKKYADRITLLLGTELDLYADIDLSPYDYYIGSVHYIFSEEGSRKLDEILERHKGEADRSASDAELKSLVKYEDWCPVDDSPEELVRFAMRDAQGVPSDPTAGSAQTALTDLATIKEKMLETAVLYFDTVGGIAGATGCDIVGHFDLITKFIEEWGFDPAGNLVKKAAFGSNSEISELIDTQDERYIAAWKRAIDRIFDDCEARYKAGHRNRLEKLGLLEAGGKPVFEINTGAISKGYRTTPYPAAEQIAYIKNKGGVLILDSDSHATGTICYGFKELRDFLLPPIKPKNHF